MYRLVKCFSHLFIFVWNQLNFFVNKEAFQRLKLELFTSKKREKE